MEKTDLITFLNDIFIPLGFKRKGNNWVYNSDVLAKIVNLQKSNFGNYFYLNYGFIIRKLKLTTTYTHIGYRLGEIDKEKQKRLEELLDLDYSVNNNVRFFELKKIISEKIIPKIQMINSEEELLTEIKKLPYSSMVPAVVKDYFGLGNW